jgi:serine/threonine protein phosphatase 1
MGRSFVIGDIHGAFRALKQCLELAEFDYSLDRLICLGDVCDGWPDVKESVEELLKIKQLVHIMGNHDEWALTWFNTGLSREIWATQGGSATMKSYADGIPESHINFLQNAHDYYLENNRLFVHGGIETEKPIELQGREVYLWNRSLVQLALYLTAKDDCIQIGGYSEIFVGHTPTQNFHSTVPLKYCNVWLMDTGAGWQGGQLSLMNIDSGQIFQSEPVNLFYPDFKGRNKNF